MAQAWFIIPAQGSDQADEWVRLGFNAQVASNTITDTAQRNSKLGEAQNNYNQALRLDPRHAIACHNLAIVFAQANFLNEALLHIERASILDPFRGAIWATYALMALEADRIGEAIDAADRALAIEANVQTLMTKATVSSIAGHPEWAVECYNRILDIDPKNAQAGVNAAFTQTLCPVSPADLLKQRRRFYEANRWTGAIPPHRNDRDEDRPLRVGYVGGDFKSHSAAFIFGRVLHHHTPAVEMYLYSTLPVDPNADANTKRFQTEANGRWRDISATSDEDAAALIRRDKIDILVDLAAHTNGGRLALFTHRPAPVQGTAWGFAHGSGIPDIQFFFADPTAVPEAERQYYAEKIVDLPCIVTFEELKAVAPMYDLKGTSLPPVRRNGYVTFGCYARYEKMGDPCIRAVGDVLRAVPDSKVQFKDAGYRRPYSLRRIMGLLPDIAPERLLFSQNTSHADHLLAYQQADICLDPWPHGGGIVTLETLWMGVPLITLYSTQPSGRTAASVLTAMGRGDWVARTHEEYVAIAVRMAEDTKGTGAARATLRDELLRSPVVAGYVEKVEEAYRTLWKAWCES